MRIIKQYVVYILTNPPHTFLYIGVTSNIEKRMFEHRLGARKTFTSHCNLHYLVYFEETSDIHSAIAREKQLKGWRRSKKEGLLGAMNPAWVALSAGV